MNGFKSHFWFCLSSFCWLKEHVTPPSTDHLHHHHLRKEIYQCSAQCSQCLLHYNLPSTIIVSSLAPPPPPCLPHLSQSDLTSPHLTPFSDIYCNCSALLTSQGQSNILLSPEFIKDSKMIKTQFFNITPPLPGQTSTFVTLHLI